MKKIVRAAEGIRTFTSPKTARRVCCDAFQDLRSLRSVVLNEGLKKFKQAEQRDHEYLGVFKGSGIRRVRLPSTLKLLEEFTFYDCK